MARVWDGAGRTFVPLQLSRATRWCDTRSKDTGGYMEARAKLLGHPIHQMLIVFPLGLLGMSVVFDLIYFAADDRVFAAVAYWMMIAGIVGGLLAAPFGLIDWMAIPSGTRAK